MLRTNKWLFCLMATALLILTWGGGSLPHAMAAPQGSSIDAVLVMDASNSMKNSDPERISGEAMKMFIDMLATTGDKVGIVSYTDKIQREKALLEIQSEADKTALKEFIDQLDRGPYTDISIGLDEAVKVLQQGADPAHAPMIVVLADGNNDLPKAGKSSQEATDDLNQAVQEAKGSGIPIYTIGLNADGKLNKETLADLADQTGGKSFITSSADDLPQILSEIFASHQQLKIVPVQSITGNGSYQEVVIHVPNANVLEANVSIMSSSPVDLKLMDPAGVEQSIPSANVMRSTSNSYSLLKLLKPQQGDWKLQVKGVSKDKIDINLVFNYDLELTMDPPPSSVKAGDTIDIKAYLVSNGQKLQDQELYGNMTAKLLVKDLDTGDESEVELENKGGSFEGEFKIPQKHDYELKVRAEEQSFYRESAPAKVSAKAAASGSGNSGNALSPGEDAKPFPLWPVIIGIAALLTVGVAAYFILRAIKQANKGFVGQIVIEIRDENTGEKTSPQYKKLTSFKGKFKLHQLLQLAPELKETEKILFMPGKNDRIILKNQSSAVVEKSGRAQDATNGMELKNGDRLRVSLQQADKTILFEYLV
ncbi:vWA domain-containing protein [Paenibacillus solani]|uniref:vWA domain-containing protein n=1 Tax=Paenibacillus solani TaxID=1705565 RepID=UPI003D2E52EC